MHDHGAPAWALAAVARELADQLAWPTVDGLIGDELVVFGKSVRQCAPQV